MSTVPAQTSLWGIAPQTAKVGTGTFGDTQIDALNWRKYRVITVTGRGMQDQAVMPMELSGVLVPTGGYKSGAYYVQEVDLIPRLEDSLGYLLYATLGSVSTIAGQKYTDTGWATLTGATGHLFRFASDQTQLPWLATRLRMPGSAADGSQVQGEVGYDCKASGLRLNVPGAGMITARFGVQGRAFYRPVAASVNAWTYENEFEDSNSIAHAGRGSLYIGSNTPKITGLTIDIINGLTRPQDEFIVGSFFPDDVAVLARSVRLRAAVKWENPDLWNLIYFGGTNGTDWTSLPYFVETAGAVKAFFFEAKSPDNMPATSVPYAIRVMANNVMLSCDPTSLRLRPGGIIEYMLNIDALDPDAGLDYIQIALDNKVTNYSWT